ncbi:MAG: DUF3445 domain-containing protein [Octadecabacter sp.]
MRSVDLVDWLRVDDAYSAQLALKADLIADQRGDVIAVCDGAGAALAELLDYALAHLPDGFAVTGEAVTRPDGVSVALDRDDPLLTLSRIVQEDLCILQKQGDEHVLTAALLCFPASWTLAQKIGKPLLAIHVPVAEYDENIAKRVQRLFDGVQVGRPLWRANYLGYDKAALYQPRREGDPRPVGGAGAPFDRSERQTVLRLPNTGAVVFSIHSTVVAVD